MHLSTLPLPLSLLTLTTSSPLQKRGFGNTQEVVYLSDCTYTNKTITSEMEYYKNFTASGIQPTPPLGTASCPVSSPGPTAPSLLSSGRRTSRRCRLIRARMCWSRGCLRAWRMIRRGFIWFVLGIRDRCFFRRVLSLVGVSIIVLR